MTNNRHSFMFLLGWIKYHFGDIISETYYKSSCDCPHCEQLRKCKGIPKWFIMAQSLISYGVKVR